MARRKSGVQQFIEGFNSVYGTTRKVIGDIKTSQVGKAEVETITGDDGKETFRFLGKNYDTRPDDATLDYARTKAYADVEKKYGDPIRGTRLGILASAEKRTADQEAFQAKASEWFQNESRQGAAQREYQEQMAQWQKANDDYQGQVAQGQSPQALGLPPAKPEAPSLTYLDTLADTAGYLNLKASHGDIDVPAILATGKALQEVRDTGVVEGLRALQSGDQAGALEALKKAGKIDLDPQSVVAMNPVKVNMAGVPMDTYELKVKQPDGSVMTINAAKQLDALGKAQDYFQRMMSVRADARAGAASARAAAADGRAATTFAQSQADRKTRQEEENERADTGVALFKEQHPEATDAQLKAVRLGILKPVTEPEKVKYNPSSANVRAALEQPALNEDGTIKTDPVSGRQVMVRDMDKEQGLAQFMTEQGITDSDEGLIKWRRAKAEQEKAAAPERAAHAQAQQLLKEGRITLEQANEALQKNGFRPLAAQGGEPPAKKGWSIFSDANAQDTGAAPEPSAPGRPARTAAPAPAPAASGAPRDPGPAPEAGAALDAAKARVDEAQAALRALRKGAGGVKAQQALRADPERWRAYQDQVQAAKDALAAAAKEQARARAQWDRAVAQDKTVTRPAFVQ